MRLGRVNQRYATDLSDEQWNEVRASVESTKGRKAHVSRREIVNAILYVARTGCQWRLLPKLPKDFPKWSTVYSCYHRWAWNGTLDKLIFPRLSGALHREVLLCPVVFELNG